jgi:hypothetical protein
VTTVLPENTSHNKVKRHVWTRLWDIMPWEPRKPRKQHARPVPRNHNKAKRPAIIVPPVGIKIKPNRFHVKTVTVDIALKARLNRYYVLPVIILHKDVQIVSLVPQANSNRDQEKQNATSVQLNEFKERWWTSIKTKPAKPHAKHALAMYRQIFEVVTQNVKSVSVNIFVLYCYKMLRTLSSTETTWRVLLVPEVIVRITNVAKRFLHKNNSNEITRSINKRQTR